MNHNNTTTKDEFSKYKHDGENRYSNEEDFSRTYYSDDSPRSYYDDDDSQDNEIDQTKIVKPVIVQYDCDASSLQSEEGYDMFDEHDKNREIELQKMLDDINNLL